MCDKAGRMPPPRLANCWSSGNARRDAVQQLDEISRNWTRDCPSFGDTLAATLDGGGSK
jgi:hypothetical protein